MDQDLLLRQLRWLTTSGDIPVRDTKQAVRVYAALTKPKRVTIMGPPNSGRLELLSLLAGNRLVGSDLDLGTIRMVYGDAPQTQFTLQDGDVQSVKGLPSAQTVPADGGVIETTISAPLPALRKISLMRLAEANDLEGQVKAMNWAAGQSDIVIWCTQRFSKIEARMWSHMPDQTRDNAYALMTTLADHDGNLKAANADLAARVGDEFAFAMAVNLKAALSAQVSTPVDKAAMSASGVTKLISTLLREIEQGRDNALALAELLVSRHSVPDDLPADDPVVQEVISQVAAPQPAAPEVSTPVEPELREMLDQINVEAADANVQAAIDELAEDFGGKAEATIAAPKRKVTDTSIFPTFEFEPELEPVAAEPEAPAASEPVQTAAAANDTPPAPAKPAMKPLSDDTIMVCKAMIVQLAAVGEGDEAEQRDTRDMCEAGLETLTWIDDALANVANDDAPRLTHLQNMTEEATDLIQLLRLEDTDTSALDAVTVLLQMKRTVYATLAA